MISIVVRNFFPIMSTIIEKIKDKAEYIYRFSVINLYVKPTWIAKLILHPKQFCENKSYFPEKKQKSRFKIWLEQISQTLRYGTPNHFYFPYGFDVKNKEERAEYLHFIPFSQLRKKGRKAEHSPTAILRDKLLFGMFTDYLGVSSPRNIAISDKDRILDLETKEFISVPVFIKKYSKGDFFAKPIDGECGDGIFHLQINDENIFINKKSSNIQDLKGRFANWRYLIQSTVIQHPLMASLHKQSINTIRLVTVRDTRSGKNSYPIVFPSILRIGTGDSIVDNTSQGGLAVGIELYSGNLKEFGFYKPEYGTKVNIHPDSLIQFSSFQIPFFKECCEQACLLHSFLSDVNSIGWDVAIGPNGPVFIEGNDNWEINGPQICNGGLKSHLETYLK